MTTLSVVSGKFVSFVSRTFGLGAGATWPGEIALRIDPHIVAKLSKRLKKGVILVAGTNGKTTTTRMIQTILEADGQSTIHNKSGANLLNGIASSLLDVANKDIDWGVFEIDENSLPLVLQQIDPYSSLRAKGEAISKNESLSLQIASSPTPRNDNVNNQKLIIVLLNLFRDQLDRYGEVDVIAEKWQKALQKLPELTNVVLNADDPLIAHLGKAVKPRPGLGHAALYFGLEEASLQKKELDHATDSTFCLNCGARLSYKGIYYSHLGIWSCPKCGERRPKPDVSYWKSPLPGAYNRYNTLAAVAAAKSIGISENVIKKALIEFKPAFGRQEEFIVPTSPEGLRGASKKIKIFLSKNPAGFNESLRTVLDLGAKQILLVLNDRIPDGRDVSWIWDVDFELLKQDENMIKEHDKHVISVSGDRVYDMAVRLKYAGLKAEAYENVSDALAVGLKENTKEALYVLATYSGMLDVRKLLSGRSIL